MWIPNPTKEVGKVHQADSSRWPPYGQRILRQCLGTRQSKRKPYTYTSMVRGTDISFAPSNIKRVLKLRKDPIPNAPSYHERKANKDYRLNHVLEDLCVIGADWVRYNDGRPHYLRRADLEPMTKGCYEFICRSILPTTNRSELIVE
ncbi:hypothetical protein PIB30_061988, partial [Stylosanthes scabra]|nr:hypothetical protein [Stylosanthes scabra]